MMEMGYFLVIGFYLGWLFARFEERRHGKR